MVAFIRVERRGSHGYAAITSLNDIQDRVGKWHQAVFIQKVSQPCSTYVGFNMIARLNISGGISNEKL
jgi:hypothetical protein